MTGMSASTARVSPGTPAGGQFAAQAHSDGGFSLDTTPPTPQLTPGLTDQIAELNRQISDLTDQQQRCVVRSIAEKVRQGHPDGARLWLRQRDGDYGRVFSPTHLDDANGDLVSEDFDRKWAPGDVSSLVTNLEADEGKFVDWDEATDDYFLDVEEGLSADVSPTVRPDEATQAREGEINYLTDKAEYLQLPEDALDEAVIDTHSRTASGQVNSSNTEFSDAHDEAERKASEVNNGGPRAQVEYLVDSWGAEEVSRHLTQLGRDAGAGGPADHH